MNRTIALITAAALAAGLLAGGPAAYANSPIVHEMSRIASDAQAAPARASDHALRVRISSLLHTVGFVWSADSRDIRPTTYIRKLDVRTYAHADGCHDLEWMRDYLAQELGGTGAIHSRGGLSWRWQGGGEDVVLSLNEDHCDWRRDGGRLSAVLAIAQFTPPDGRQP